MLPTHSIFAESFNHYYGLFTQAGLIIKWMNDALYILQLENEVISRKHIRDKTLILTLSHLQTAFYILFLGTVLSLVAFLGEIYHARRERSLM